MTLQIQTKSCFESVEGSCHISRRSTLTATVRDRRGPAGALSPCVSVAERGERPPLNWQERLERRDSPCSQDGGYVWPRGGGGINIRLYYSSICSLFRTFVPLLLSFSRRGNVPVTVALWTPLKQFCLGSSRFRADLRQASSS